MLKRLLTRVSDRPVLSSAAMVLANVGGALVDAIAAISPRVASIARAIAGLKSATLILSNRGKPPCGPVQGASSGSTVTAAPLANDSARRQVASTAVAAAVWNKVRLSMAAPRGHDTLIARGHECDDRRVAPCLAWT